MSKYVLLISLLIYLISCTSNDNGIMHLNGISSPRPVKTSLGNRQSGAAEIKKFDNFLAEFSLQQMIHASETDFHEKIGAYLPDSVISKGYDLHIREIGRIDTFRLVFHEYFDLYDDWSKTYLNIFSPYGDLLQSLRLWNLSFEGNTSIKFINNKIVEIAYHDFFKREDLLDHALIPDQIFYLSQPSTVNNLLEGTIYEYYKIAENGILKTLSLNTKISKGRHFPQSSAKLLSESELTPYTISEIKLIKNEILAEHGYRFPDLATQAYFERQPWYSPSPENKDSVLTDIERLNFDCLSKVEKEY